MVRKNKVAEIENPIKRKILEEMSLKKFAKLAGVTPPDLSYYLNKNKKVKASKRKKIKVTLIKLRFVPKPSVRQYAICEHCGSKVRILTK
ncbi:MAG: LacI family DNA-binding transcriptional regulator [Ignavibacteriota bacterium]|jgi:hypothetical protein|nr:LacI family DNA-binding transcriptional regulator [Ignavibacteriota bacterium]MCC7094936.1 LacI family DNA-binding transcriptional regulator [Ignavibacteriaceae bacterium]MCE7856239.1 LacI family DNA-binding transcriptional regulator [Ignavibacteria bacterium CHB3]MEB2297673.1 LacI family DNA-binding transcriptional regulator [Ignavibacteria bacterium]NUM61297.1 LacI family DNA-binding transcriptional regulator [Ignavibacteriaceae bacterium]